MPKVKKSVSRQLWLQAKHSRPHLLWILQHQIQSLLSPRGRVHNKLLNRKVSQWKSLDSNSQLLHLSKSNLCHWLIKESMLALKTIRWGNSERKKTVNWLVNSSHRLSLIWNTMLLNSNGRILRSAISTRRSPMWAPRTLHSIHRCRRYYVFVITLTHSSPTPSSALFAGTKATLNACLLT